MQTEIELFPISATAWGYTVTSERGHYIRQEFAPGASGFVAMSQAEAQSFAEAEVARLTTV